MAGLDRTAAAALFATDFQREVIQETTKRSVALQTFRTLPMGAAVTKMPVLNALPTARFLTAVQEVKPQSVVSWDDITLTAEEIAVIVPIDDTTLADSTIDITATLRELIAQEFGRVLDAAVFFGTGAPSTYPVGGIHGRAVAAGNTLAYDTSDPLGTWSDAFSLVEDPGGDVTNIWAARSMRGLLRTTRDNGNPSSEVNLGGVYGLDVAHPLGWNKSKAWALLGDRDYAMLGLRQDLTFSFSNQATLTDFGNLWEKDSTAIRAVMRVGFALADPYRLEVGGRELPFAAITPDLTPGS